MRLEHLAEQVGRVRGHRGRLNKIELLRKVLLECDEPARPATLCFLCGELPMGKVGVGPKMIHRLRRRLESAAEGGVGPTVREVCRVLEEVKDDSGGGSLSRREDRLHELLEGCSRVGRRFLLRLLAGELRQGALAGTVEAAVVAACGCSEKLLRRAVTLTGSVPAAAELAFAGGDSALSLVRMEVFRSLSPMLADSVATVEEALQMKGRSFWELKLDGARIQTHREGGRVRVFSRSHRDVTSSVPEVVEHALSLSSQRFILDGEVLSFGPHGRPYPFQLIMKRFGRRKVDHKLEEQIPLTPNYFDILLLDEQEFLEEPFLARREVLEETVGGHVVKGALIGEPEQASDFLEQALRAGHEGVMVKGPEGRYEAGKRGAEWLKLKPFHTLDLVVLAAEWGSGRRSGFLSNLHLGARDNQGRFVMLGKTFKGLTDELLEWQTGRLLELESGRTEQVVQVVPALVVEVAFNELQESPHYPAGLALRFARVRRYRPDKVPEQADTLDAVRKIFRESRSRQATL